MQQSDTISQSPEESSRRCLALRAAESQRLSHRLNRFVKKKRFIINLVVGYSVFDHSAALLIVPLVIMLIPAVFLQNRLARRLRRLDRAAEFHRHALARIEDRWIGDGQDGKQYPGENELFADDLHVFGKASLFQFLCTARTSVGRDALADWLNHPADADEIRERQSAVRELADNSDLREHLAILDPEESSIDPQAVTSWASVPELMLNGSTRAAGVILAVALVVVIVVGSQLPVLVRVSVIAVELMFFLVVRDRLRRVRSTGRAALGSLAYLSAMNSAIRNTSFTSRRLSDLQNAIAAPGTHSKFGFPLYRMATDLALLLLPACQFILNIDHRRRSLGMTAERALLALGELEALASLAHYAFVQPEATYPEIMTAETCYEAADLGHPLIRASDRVRNDIELNAALRLLIISGSNMSGKSTMLRTVGINAVLALCGAPVCAKDMRISPFSIGTAMRFSDSLEHRTSYFYAVIKRLRAVMKLQDEDRPVLFLIDEILQGTNSRDRIEGAKAFVRKLTDSGGVGMVTTHDLELTRIVDTFDGRATNVHFVDQLANGEILFDYKMRPGVVQTSNALALMRSMGLDL
jgi:hypothetical protein